MTAKRAAGDGPLSEYSNRVSSIRPSATLAISEKARELNAQGRSIIGFGAGEPDFVTPEHVVAAAQTATTQRRMHSYSPAGGLPELRRAIAAKTEADSGLTADPSEVIVSNGGKQALYQVFQALLNPGDEVLLPSPYWVTYPEQIRLAGGVVVPIPTSSGTSYKVSIDDLEQHVSSTTKALVFVSPSNPTGTVYDRAEMAEIGRWAADQGMWIVTDEIYEKLLYGDAEFSSMPVVARETRGRCVVVNGVSKAYAMTGWRVGWTIAPSDLAARLIALQSHLSSNVCNVAQAAALAALTGPQDTVEAMRQAFDRRRRFVLDQLRSIDGVDCPEPQGAFYVFPDVSGVLGRPLASGQRPSTTLELAEYLLEVAGVALVPGEAFGAPGCLRISYCVSDDSLDEGLGRIRQALG